MGIVLLVAIYCGWQTVRDFRSRNYWMAAAGAACVAAILLTPIQSHAIKIDLPVETPR